MASLRISNGQRDLSLTLRILIVNHHKSHIVKNHVYIMYFDTFRGRGSNLFRIILSDIITFTKRIIFDIILETNSLEQRKYIFISREHIVLLLCIFKTLCTLNHISAVHGSYEPTKNSQPYLILLCTLNNELCSSTQWKHWTWAWKIPTLRSPMGFQMIGYDTCASW